MIGSRYEETIEELKEKIRNGNIRILDEKDFKSNLANFGFLCYFCKNPIDGKIRILADSDLENQIKRYYPIDSKCYAKAKGIELISQSH